MCRSKSSFVAFATPTFIQFATNGASSWRRITRSSPAMRSSAVSQKSYGRLGRNLPELQSWPRAILPKHPDDAAVHRRHARGRKENDRAGAGRTDSEARGARRDRCLAVFGRGYNSSSDTPWSTTAAKRCSGKQSNSLSLNFCDRLACRYRDCLREMETRQRGRDLRE
jgi:hypothetical protein